MLVEDKIALNVTEAAAALGVSRPVVYRLIKCEGFPAFKIGSRTVIPRLAFEAWINKHGEERRDIV